LFFAVGTVNYIYYNISGAIALIPLI